MRLIAEVRERLRALFFRAAEDRETVDELRFHLDMQVEENLRRGMVPAEARRQARIRLGGLAQIQEATRDARGLRWLETLAQDVRYALRGFRANPLFAATLVLALGGGVGANAAVFSVVDALLLRPLPYGGPERLVAVAPAGMEYTAPFGEWDVARIWSERHELFGAALLHTRRLVHYTGGAEPITVMAEAVSPGFEETLGVRPMLGRGFEPPDARPGAEPVAVLSDGFWHRAFGADPGVIGRVIEVEGAGHRVIGVMPPDFKFPTYDATVLWVPLRDDGAVFGAATGYAYLVGRLAAGAGSVEAAQGRADALAAGLDEAMPGDESWRVHLMPLAAANAADPTTRRAVAFLAIGVGLILLVAALNGVNLLLVRGWSRVRELAVRVAIGAGRRRLVRQLLTESVLLALASGVVAVVLAVIALRAIQGIMPTSIAFWAPHAIEVERRTIAFTFAVATGAGLLIGLVPAILATRIGTAAAAAGLSPYATRTPAHSRVRRGLIVAEVALSVALLLGAGLMIHSFVRLTRVDPGFELDGLAGLTLHLSPGAHPTRASRAAYAREIEARLEGIPGITGVTVAMVPPVYRLRRDIRLEAEGAPPPAAGQPEILPAAFVRPDFFDVLGVRVIAGRPLGSGDIGTDNVIIDRDLARFLWGEQSPLGRRFRVGAADGAASGDAGGTGDGGPPPWHSVVGVIDDLRMLGPDAREGDFEVLYPAARDWAPVYLPLAIRTRGDPRPLFPAIRAALHQLDAEQPILELRTAESLYGETIDLPRFLLVLMSVLAGLALLLAAIGIYGVLAYGVAQRRFDLGVRLALGAQPERLARAVLAEGLGLAAAGAALGVGGSLTAAGLLRGLLFEVEPADPVTLGAVLLICLAAAALASHGPARRTARIDPVEVLKAN